MDGVEVLVDLSRRTFLRGLGRRHPVVERRKDHRSLLVSPSLPPNVARTFALPLKYQGADLGERTRTYLAYHRAQVFRSKT